MQDAMNDQRKNFLLVDSGNVDLDRLRKSLKKSVYQIQLDIVPDLANTWQRLKHNKYHLLMANYLLPDGKGTELLNNDTTDGTPIVVLGNSEQRPIIESIILAGAVDFWLISDDFYLNFCINFTRVLGQHKRLMYEQTHKRRFEKEQFLFRTFIDNVPDMVYFKDRKSRFIRINKAMCKHVNLKDPLQAIGKTDFDFYDIEHAQPAFDGEQQIMTTGEIIQIEEKEVWPDGHETWASTIKMPYYDQDGNASGTFGISKDITEQKNAQFILKKERDFISAILDTANVLIIVYDTEGKIIRFNHACSELTGYSLGQVKDKVVWETLVPEDEIAGFQQYFQSILGTQFKSILNGTGKRNIKFSWKNIKNENRMIEWSGSVLYDEKGKVEFVVNIGIDVTERNEAQETIRRYSDTLNYMDMGMYIYHLEDLNDDHMLRMVDVNPAAEKIIGLSKDKCVNQLIDTLFPNLREIGIPQIYADVARKGHSQELGEIHYADERINPSWYHMRAFPLPNHHVVVSFEDITERKIMESQTLQTQKLESIGQLAAGIAHEINTPTQYVGDNIRFFSESFADIRQVIVNFRELLTQAKTGKTKPKLIQQLESDIHACDLDYLLDEIPTAIEQSLEGVDRVTKIVRAMKEFSHPAGKEMTNLDINQLIETTVTVTRNEWKYVAEMILDLDPAMPLVPCLPDEFNQVLLNIIVNAAHAIGDVVKNEAAPLGKITIRTNVTHEYAEVHITDTGAGIPKEIQDKIFNPFFTTKEVGKGTGQGLSISHHVIVKKHGGKITVRSTMGKGSTFTIQLPLSHSSDT